MHKNKKKNILREKTIRNRLRIEDQGRRVVITIESTRELFLPEIESGFRAVFSELEKQVDEIKAKKKKGSLH